MSTAVYLTWKNDGSNLTELKIVQTPRIDQPEFRCLADAIANASEMSGLGKSARIPTAQETRHVHPVLLKNPAAFGTLYAIQSDVEARYLEQVTNRGAHAKLKEFKFLWTVGEELASSIRAADGYESADDFVSYPVCESEQSPVPALERKLLELRFQEIEASIKRLDVEIELGQLKPERAYALLRSLVLREDS